MYKYVKHTLDFVLALTGFIVLIPLLLVITVILLFVNDGKPFFTQKRPGKKGKPFRIVKFRSMTDHKDRGGNLLPDTRRLTRVGVFLRRNSLDELPQLINIIKGDMSIVGPRPLLTKHLEGLDNEGRVIRQSVRPGVTGWAQVNGRNALSFSQKFELDMYYVKHLSFRFDMKILWMTVLKVFKRDGVNTRMGLPVEPE